MSVYKAKIKFNRLGPDEYEIEIDDTGSEELDLLSTSNYSAPITIQSGDESSLEEQLTIEDDLSEEIEYE